MTPTTQQKIDIIQSILDDPEKRPRIGGLCIWIAAELNNEYNYTEVKQLFGLTKYEPEKHEIFWWSFLEYAKRLEVLRCVLSDLQEELEKELTKQSKQDDIKRSSRHTKAISKLWK